MLQDLLIMVNGRMLCQAKQLQLSRDHLIGKTIVAPSLNRDLRRLQWVRRIHESVDRHVQTLFMHSL